MLRCSRPRHSCLRFCHVLLIYHVGQWQYGLQCPAHKNLNYGTEMFSVPLVPALFPTLCAELSLLQNQRKEMSAGSLNGRDSRIIPKLDVAPPNINQAQEEK